MMFRSSHGSDDVDVVLLGCYAVWTSRLTPTLRRNILLHRMLIIDNSNLQAKINTHVNKQYKHFKLIKMYNF
jgi:hypothetical protein